MSIVLPSYYDCLFSQRGMSETLCFPVHLREHVSLAIIMAWTESQTNHTMASVKDFTDSLKPKFIPRAEGRQPF